MKRRDLLKSNRYINEKAIVTNTNDLFSIESTLLLTDLDYFDEYIEMHQ